MGSVQNPSDLVISFQESRKELGSSKVANYIYRYLTELKAISCVIERKYVDKDFLLDYSKYYSRSFRNGNERFTQRIHFFNCPLTSETFHKILADGSDEDTQKLNESYLGFAVIKPIKNGDGDPLIGRTLLATYSEEDGTAERVFIKHTYHVSLFGINLNIVSLPFQTQDSTVGGCATIACWIALHPLSKLFDVSTLSPYEVTERSISFISESRNFPSKGLTIQQMKSCFTQIGLDTEFIMPQLIQGGSSAQKHDDIIADAVKAYINMGIPIIAGVAIQIPNQNTGRTGQNPNFALHAVVISGYRHENGRVTELYLHDDGIGPYCRTKPVGDFSSWHNEWVSAYGYNYIYVQKLLVPVYPKIRMEFSKIYKAYQYWRNELDPSLNPDHNSLLQYELFLVDMKEYKKELLKMKFIDKGNSFDKIAVLQEPMPRFLWIFRQRFTDKRILDIVHDATDERNDGMMAKLHYIN